MGRLWNVETGAELVRLTWPKDASSGSWQHGFTRVARYHPDGRTIVTGGVEHSAGGADPYHPAIWGADRGQFIASLRREEPNFIFQNERVATEAAISSDGRLLAIAYKDGLVRLLSSSGTPLKSLSGHTRAIRALAFHTRRCRLVRLPMTGRCGSGHLRIGEEADLARGRWPEVEHALYSPDGRIIAAAGPALPDGPVIAFRDAASGREPARTEKLGAFLKEPILFSRDSRALLDAPGTAALTTRRGPTLSAVLTLVDTASGRPLRTIDLNTGGDCGLAFSPDGLTVAVADGDGHLIEIATGRSRLQLEVPGPSHPRYSLQSGRDVGRHAQLEGGVCDIQLRGYLRLPLGRDGRRLAVLKDSDPELRRSSPGDRFSPRRSPARDRLVRLHGPDLDVATGRERVVLRGHGGDVNSVVFAADGRRVLTASHDGTARLWNAGRGRELARLEGHDGPVRTAAFSPDGATILTYGDDRTVRLWNGADGRPLCTCPPPRGHPLGGLQSRRPTRRGLVLQQTVLDPYLARRLPVRSSRPVSS